MERFRMGHLYRYARPANPDAPFVDGIPNFHYAVAMQGFATLQLEKGINAPVTTRAVDGERFLRRASISWRSTTGVSRFTCR